MRISNALYVTLVGQVVFADECDDVCQLHPECSHPSTPGSLQGSYCRNNICHRLHWVDSSCRSAGCFVHTQAGDEFGKIPLSCSDAKQLLSGFQSSGVKAWIAAAVATTVDPLLGTTRQLRTRASSPATTTDMTTTTETPSSDPTTVSIELTTTVSASIDTVSTVTGSTSETSTPEVSTDPTTSAPVVSSTETGGTTSLTESTESVSSLSSESSTPVTVGEERADVLARAGGSWVTPLTVLGIIGGVGAAGSASYMNSDALAAAGSGLMAAVRSYFN